MPSIKREFCFPSAFITGRVDLTKPDEMLVADALAAWFGILNGYLQPPKFYEALTLIGLHVDCCPDYDGLLRWDALRRKQHIQEKGK